MPVFSQQAETNWRHHFVPQHILKPWTCLQRCGFKYLHRFGNHLENIMEEYSVWGYEIQNHHLLLKNFLGHRWLEDRRTCNRMITICLP